MTTARLRVRFAGPHVSFQDAGRVGNMRFGVPASGPMDRLAHSAANVAIGNDLGATAIEVSIGGLIVECLSGAVTVAIAGGQFSVEHRRSRAPSWSVLSIRQGEEIAIKAGSSGSWAYLAIAGDLDVSRWLGHTATHSMSGLGGGAVRTGQEFDVSAATVMVDRQGVIPPPTFGSPAGVATVVMGPQDHYFDQATIERFCGSPFAFTEAYDRMGVRLNGPSLHFSEALSIPSEAMVRGSVQVAGDGIPTLLLADHPTTGGYPKIATVVSADLDGLAQLRPGDTIRFNPVEPSEAIALTRARAKRVTDYLASISRPGRTLAQRLMLENLIGGIIEDTDD